MEENSGKRKYSPMEISDFLKDAEKLEKNADALRKGKGDVKSEEFGLMYLDAGALRVKAGDFNGAEEDYLNAQRYSFSHDIRIKNTIDKYLNALRSEKIFSSWKKGTSSSKRLNAVLSISFLAIALFFVSMNLTGNVIAGVNASSSRIIGICFFTCGLIFAFIYLRSRSKVKSKAKNKVKGRKRK
jgi:hypothetical protein